MNFSKPNRLKNDWKDHISRDEDWFTIRRDGLLPFFVNSAFLQALCTDMEMYLLEWTGIYVSILSVLYDTRIFWHFPERSRYSDWLRAGRPRARSSSSGRVKNFLFLMSFRPALGYTQPPIQCIPGVKQRGHEADHSPSASVEVKEIWIYTSTPP
jgi:hypothetical protein